MNKNKKILMLVVPVVALIVIFESVVLVNDLMKKRQNIAQKSAETVVVKKEGEPVFDLIFGTENKNMEVGKKYQIELNVLSKANYLIDSMSLYINYDSSAFDISGLTYDEKLPKPYFSKISPQKNLIVMNYLIQDTTGYELSPNNIVALAKFEVVPKKEGSFDFEINTGNVDKESATMFIENASGKVLPYSSNKLTVTSTK